jgi:hypothetical protein
MPELRATRPGASRHTLHKPISCQLRHPKELGLFAVMLQTFQLDDKWLDAFES